MKKVRYFCFNLHIYIYIYIYIYSLSEVIKQIRYTAKTQMFLNCQILVRQFPRKGKYQTKFFYHFYSCFLRYLEFTKMNWLGLICSLVRNLIWPFGWPHIFTQGGCLILFIPDHFSGQHQIGKARQTLSSSELFRTGQT